MKRAMHAVIPQYCTHRMGASLHPCAKPGPCAYPPSKVRLDFFLPSCASARNIDMALLQAHQRLLEEDADEELTDAQVRELLEDASRRMREKQASSQPTTTSTGPFKLPKLKAGHIADTYTKTQGNITRLDSAKLVNKRDQVMANGVKKIEDPVAVKAQKLEVSYELLEHSIPTPPLMIIIPFSSEQTLGPSWVPPCTTEGTIIS